ARYSPFRNSPASPVSTSTPKRPDRTHVPRRRRPPAERKEERTGRSWLEVDRSSFVRRVFRRLRSNSEYHESQGRVYRADARRGGHQAARRTGLVVRTEVRWLSRARSQGRRRRPIAVAQRQ